MKRVRDLVRSHTKDTVNVARNQDLVSLGTYSSCLTSGQSFDSAPELSGLLSLSSDVCLVNRIQFRGRLLLHSDLMTSSADRFSTQVRKLLVWFHKPLMVASDSGTLPPITEVLVSDTIQSQFFTEAANAGRYEVLYDRVFDLGENSYDAAGNVRLVGQNVQYYDVDVPVGLPINFVLPPTIDNLGGHYGALSAAGRVSSGLCVLYTQVLTCDPSVEIYDYCTTRINYTG